MKSVIRSRSATLLFTLLFSMALNGCSLFGRSEGTPEAKYAVLVVVNQYLTAIASGRSSAIRDAVAWSDYRRKNGEQLTSANVEQIVEALKGKFNRENHPLVDLDVKDLELDDNLAKVSLQKRNDSDAQLVKLELVWTGGGWVIVDDNIFEDGGVLQTSLSASGVGARKTMKKSGS